MSVQLPKLPRYPLSPLGIIGTFISFVYGIAGAVLGFGSDSFNIYLQSALTAFVVLFPCLILRVFFVLVTKHADTLYSPADFSDQRLFVTYLGSFTNKSPGEITINDYDPATEASDTKDGKSTHTVVAKKKSFVLANTVAYANVTKPHDSPTQSVTSELVEVPNSRNNWIEILGKEAVAINSLMHLLKDKNNLGVVTELKMPGCDIIVTSPSENNFIDVKLITENSLITTIISHAMVLFIKGAEFFQFISGPTTAVKTTLVFVIDEMDPGAIQRTRGKIHDAMIRERNPFPYEIYDFDDLLAHAKPDGGHL